VEGIPNYHRLNLTGCRTSGVKPLLDSHEIQLGRKLSLAADKHRSQAGAAPEGQPVEGVALQPKRGFRYKVLQTEDIFYIVG
jgi:hypothetical protein